MAKWQPSIELERLIQLVCQEDQEPVIVITVSESDKNLKVTVVIETPKK